MTDALHELHESVRSALHPDEPFLRVCMFPSISGEDDGQGGIRRVIEGQLAHLPAFGIEYVDDPAQADVLAAHIGFPQEWLRDYPDKPFVAHNHGVYNAEYQWPKWAMEANALALDAIRVADVTTVPSEWVARMVERHTCRRPMVIPHGVDAYEWSPAASKIPFVFWDKTRSDPVCDPAIVNEVAKLLPDVQFVTTFGTPTPNVSVTGRLPFAAARQLTREAAVYLATTRETFGIATLQALACEVPVAGFDWAANSEILTHEVDSYLARPNDAKDLADGIRWCLANRQKAGRAARETAERYPWDNAARMYAAAYREAWHMRNDPRPRVSFVVRAFNMERYLANTLTSLRTQHLQDWECVVVDDGSTDGTLAIAEGFAGDDERFRIVRRPNGGIVDAMNDGVERATGRYVMAVDADDMVALEGPLVLADALDRDRTIGAAYGNLLFVGEDGMTPMEYGGRYSPGHAGWPSPWDWHAQRRGMNLIPYCTMYRREAWAAVGGHRRRLTTAEDADFWLRISSYGWRPQMATEADVLVYRVRGDSYSRRAKAADWISWYPWRVESWLSPAGVLQDASFPVHLPSFDPPAISVIIPVGPGHERLVLDAIDSIEAQTFRWWECIVINDTGAPLPPLPAWVQVIDPPERFGSVASARNAGIATARARQFLPLDADDILEPQGLETFWTEHKLRPETLLYSDFWENPYGDWKVFKTSDWNCDEILRRTVATVTQLTPVSAWKAVGGYREDTAWEDWAFQLDLAVAGYCSARIARPLFSYRKNTGSRARANYADREAGKARIRELFGDYIEGKKLLMACGCSKNSITTSFPAAAVLPPNVDGMKLIRYEGNNVANFSVRSPLTGRSYMFRKGQERYVLDADIDWIQRAAMGFMLAPIVPQDSTTGAPILQSAQG